MLFPCSDFREYRARGRDGVLVTVAFARKKTGKGTRPAHMAEVGNRCSEI